MAQSAPTVLPEMVKAPKFPQSEAYASLGWSGGGGSYRADFQADSPIGHNKGNRGLNTLPPSRAIDTGSGIPFKLGGKK